ncbi:MAG: ABC transporter ATP-binding protein/permease [Candidatus Cloacimonetes bacterium]|nr:ABC transporter ATP-binding protein/permease [Candidatus Cloacimonadota bacterium]
MKETFKHVLPLLRRGLPRIGLGVFLLLICDALQLVVPKIIQWAVDGMGRPGFTQTNLLHGALLIISIVAAVVALKYFWRILLIGNTWGIERDLRAKYYAHLMRMGQNFYNERKTGDLMALATNDLTAVRMMFGFGFVAGADMIFQSIASLLFMGDISLRLTLLAIVPLPIMTVFIMVMGKKMHKRFREVQTAFADMSGEVQESISGIRVVKAFVQEENSVKSMARHAYTYVKSNIALVRLHATFHPFMILIISVSMGIVMVFGGRSVIRGDISIGGYVAFSSYLGLLAWPMIAIGWIVNMYQRGTASLKRLNEIFNIEPEIVDEDVDATITSIRGAVEVCNLEFRYRPETPVIFDGIDFSLQAGHTLAIVGRTGCGKSTLVNLLARVYNPPRDTFYIDGHDIYKIPLDVLRRYVVMVPQEIFLFGDTLAANIAFGMPQASREDIEKVAKMARVHDDIIDFEKGYDTIVGERGVTLSGGQKQRIAMARAFLMDPSVLVLDDSLSAVDTKTEKEILEQIVRVRQGKTTIMIAHRISSIQHADQTIVLENGKVIERGGHAELIASKGIYSYLWEKQQIEEKLKER